MKWLRLLVCGALLFSNYVSADYLEIRRNALVKASPERDAPTLTRLVKGDLVTLLDDVLPVNNYYRVYLPSQNQSGWVYRTLVRRHSGSILNVESPTERGVSVSSLTGDDVMRAHFINVGQGDATLLEFSCGLVLIDAGGRTDEHVTALNSYIAEVIDESIHNEIATVYITHTHTDHNRSLQELVETQTVRNYVHNGVYDGSGRFKARWMRDHRNDAGRNIDSRIVKQSELETLANRSGLTDGVIDPLDCADISILSGHYENNTAAWPEGEFENGNNKGIVIRVDYGESSFLFTGDMEEHALETLVDFYKGTSTLDTDVYQVGHHGSYNGTNNELLDAVTPDIAVLSFGPREVEESWTAWAYGHPRQTLIDMLSGQITRSRVQPKTVYIAPRTKAFIPVSMSDAIYGTGWDGNVVIEANLAGQMVVKTER